jgi:hypothetical protein
LTLHEFFVQFVKVGVRVAPLNAGEAEIQIAERTANGNVRQTEVCTVSL